MGRANNSFGEGWGLALLPMQCLQTPMRIDAFSRNNVAHYFGKMRELAGCLGGYIVEYDCMLFMTMLFSCLPLIAKQNDQALKSSVRSLY